MNEKYCPFSADSYDCTDGCALYCDTEKRCSIAVIATELHEMNEND